MIMILIRYVSPSIMDLYGYMIERNQMRKVVVDNHDAVHFFSYNRHNKVFNSVLWFSAGEEFYYITWLGKNITPTISEIVKNTSQSKYSHDEFYEILNNQYINYKIYEAIESQRF